jgi:hypothetical protein
MSIRQMVIRATVGAAVTLPLLTAGCVSMSGDVQGARLTDNFQVYPPFDNERDSGPSYLVGAPSHHPGPSPADPKGPPLTGAPPTEGSTSPASPQPPP